MIARKGYRLAKITQRSVSGMTQKFKCACGKVHALGSYVCAHWNEKLQHTCECGRVNLVQSGVVLTKDKAPNK